MQTLRRPGAAMGNQCMRAQVRPPSAMQLCQSYERHSQDGDARARPQQQQSRWEASTAESPAGDPASSSIWQFVAREEVQALGEIVKTWSRGTTDGFTARRHLQMRVLRNQCPIVSSAPGSSGQRGPNPGPATQVQSSAGDDGTSAAAQPAAAGRASAALASRLRGASQGQVRMPSQAWPAASGRTVLADATSPNSLFALMAPFFAGVAGSELGSQHEVHSLVDAVFGVRLFEEARGLAMRELGLDGLCALPDEVSASFREKATGILEASRQGTDQQAITARLDIVRLCFCTEILRHIHGPSRGLSSTLGLSRSAPAPAQQTSGLDGRRIPRDMAEVIARTMGSTTNMEMLFVMGGPRSPGSRMMLVGLSGSGPGMGAIHTIVPGGGLTIGGSSIRMEPSFLQDRVVVLLETLLMTEGLHLTGGGAGPVGLSAEEMDQQCPLSTRCGVDENCCPVCLENSEAGEEIRTMPCGHKLHRQCCEAWLRIADTCPMCRFQVPRQPPA